MNAEQTHSTIRAHIEAMLKDVPVVFDNAPEPTQAPGVEPSPWVRCAVRTIGTTTVAIGGTGPGAHRYRTTGSVVLSIFNKADTGDGDALRLADRISRSMRSTTVGSVVFRTPSVVTLGRVAGSWQVNVACPFYADTLT